MSDVSPGSYEEERRMEVVGERGDMAYITAVWCARTGCGAPGLSAAVCDYCDRGGGCIAIRNLGAGGG